MTRHDNDDMTRRAAHETPMRVGASGAEDGQEVADRVYGALTGLVEEYLALTATRPATDEGWSQRCAAIALNTARRAGWWGVLLTHDHRRGGLLHRAFHRAVVAAQAQERADARFWRDTAADYRARAEHRPTSDTAGSLCNRDELGVPR